MACSSSVDLFGEEGEHRAEAVLYRGIGDQTLLVQLRGANLGELAQTRDAGAQLELCRRSQA